MFKDDSFLFEGMEKVNEVNIHVLRQNQMVFACCTSFTYPDDSVISDTKSCGIVGFKKKERDLECLKLCLI